jgi:hypothetical protein
MIKNDKERGLLDVLFRHLMKGLKKTTRDISQDGVRPDRDSNPN